MNKLFPILTSPLSSLEVEISLSRWLIAAAIAISAVMKAYTLLLSPFMQCKLRRGIAHQFSLFLMRRHNERMKQQRLL